MARSWSRITVLALGATLLVPAASFAMSPAATWTTGKRDTQTPDPCIALYGANLCDRPGGMSARTTKALILSVDHDKVVYHRSTTSGTSWGPAIELVPSTATDHPAVASFGSDTDVGYYQPYATKQIRYRSTADFGATWGPAGSFGQPRQVVTGVAVAVNNGVHAVVASGYDEIPQDRPGNAIRIRTGVEGGDYPVQTRTLAWSGLGCYVVGTNASVAITTNGTVVLAYWQNCHKLVVRRSTDLGHTFSAPKTLSTGSHTMGMAIAAHGARVVLAYTADGKTFTRTSTDNGKTWSAPLEAGSGAASLRLAYGGGEFHLLAAGKTSIRYRHSVNGTSWSAGETVDQFAAGTRTFAIGIAVGNDVLSAYAVRESASDVGLYTGIR